MNLDLDTFAPAIAAIGRAGVPFLEQGLTAVLSGAAGPFGMLVSPALNTLWPAINAKFGLAPDAAPEQTAAAIQADPDATAKLQAVADEHHDEIQRAMARDALDEKNVEDARATEVQRAVHGSRAERLAPLVLAAIIVMGFHCTFLAVLLLHISTTDPVVVYVLTIEGAAFLALVGYCFGSSVGSKAKTDLIAAGLPPARRARQGRPMAPHHDEPGRRHALQDYDGEAERPPLQDHMDRVEMGQNSRGGPGGPSTGASTSAT